MDAQIEQVGVVGSGTIAIGLLRTIARVTTACALVRSPESEERLRARLADCPHPVVVSQDRQVLAQCSFVIDAVAENIADKLEVLGIADAATPVGAILASTTSSLMLSELSASCPRHGPVVGFHPFTPVQRMDVVELAFTDDADDDVRRRTVALCHAIGKQPVEVPAIPGYVVNRVLFPYLFAAVELATSADLRPEEIDLCITGGIAHPLGPFAVLDLIGLDVAVAIGESLGLDIPQRLGELVARGDHGRKTGRGFYAY